MKISPIDEVGPSCTGNLYNVSYNKLVEAIGFEPNATELDDPDKVKASWGIQDDAGRKAFVWCFKYYGDVHTCTYWSTYDPDNLLDDLLKNLF